MLEKLPPPPVEAWELALDMAAEAQLAEAALDALPSSPADGPAAATLLQTGPSKTHGALKIGPPASKAQRGAPSGETA